MRSEAKWSRQLVRLVRDPVNVITLVLVVVLAAIVLMPGLIATHDPYAIRPADRLRPPSLGNYFGTDELGRDVFSRVIHGVRISLLAALTVVITATVVGTVVGLLAGFYRNAFDEAVMRLADILVAFPQLVMAMVIVALFGPSLQNAMLAIIVIWWPQYARLVRGQVLTKLGEDYVQAARALGASNVRIQFLHILPNCSGPILVRASLDVGTALLLTASLSFLGLGAAPPTPELGALVNEGRDFLMTSWWYSTFPGLFILLCVLALNMSGDMIHDLLDPMT